MMQTVSINECKYTNESNKLKGLLHIKIPQKNSSLLLGLFRKVVPKLGAAEGRCTDVSARIPT